MTRPRTAKPSARRASQAPPEDACHICSQGQLLGRLEGKLDAMAKAQEEHGQKLDRLDTRLRSVENKGAIAGAAAAIMVALGIDLVKGILTRGRG